MYDGQKYPIALTRLKIAPEAVEQFLSVFSEVNLARTLREDPARTLRKIRKLLQIPRWRDGSRWAEICEIDPHATYVAGREYLFRIVRSGTSLLVDQVLSIKELERLLRVREEAQAMLRSDSSRTSRAFQEVQQEVRFTQHALDRLTERYPIYNRGRKLDDPKHTALLLFSKAREDGAISSAGKVVRLIDNKYEEVRYFMSGKWRFVVKDSGKNVLEVLTIEWAYHTK